MKEIAQVLLLDRSGKLLIYLRDNRPDIPFPNHWDLFGGHLEAGETPEQALVREVQEELNLELQDWRFFRRYECRSGDAYPNVKHIYHAQIDRHATDLVLNEGQRLTAIALSERCDYKFANILAAIVEDFASSDLWRAPVDKSSIDNPAK